MLRPDFKCFEVNILGVMYTAHLAYFYLPRNPQSDESRLTREPAPNTRDRHLLLIGSVASLAGIAGQVQYGIAKHGVMGMFRSLRQTSFTVNVRINMLCPYYIDTPLIPVDGRLIIAGSAHGKVCRSA